MGARIGSVGHLLHGGDPHDGAGVRGICDHLGHRDTVVALASAENQRYRAVFVCAGCVHLGRQSAGRAAQSLCSTVFLGPRWPCGCKGIEVLSRNSSGNAGHASCSSCSHWPRHTSARSQRRKRMCIPHSKSQTANADRATDILCAPDITPPPGTRARSVPLWHHAGLALP